VSKAYEILQVIAKKVVAGESITFAPDWGLGSGTIVFKDGSHTHFGSDCEDDERKAVDDFVEGLHGLLVRGSGLSVCPPDPSLNPIQPEWMKRIQRERQEERERIIGILLTTKSPYEFLGLDHCGTPCWREEKLRAALEP